jgi:hypothetical protein
MYDVDMGSGAMIYIPSLIIIGSGIQNLIGSDTRTDTQTASCHKPTSIFSKYAK